MTKQGWQQSEILVQICVVGLLVVGVKSNPIGNHSTINRYRHQYDLRPYINQAGRHNLVLGTPYGEGEVLHEMHCWEKYEFRQERSCTFQYKAKPEEIITAILVYDRWDDDTGGTGDLLSGGPYEDVVVVKITSQLSRGLDSVFKVYGVRR